MTMCESVVRESIIGLKKTRAILEKSLNDDGTNATNTYFQPRDGKSTIQLRAMEVTRSGIVGRRASRNTGGRNETILVEVEQLSV